MNQPTLPTEQHIQWQQWIARWQQSGLSQTAFCNAHDLVYHQFTYWRRKCATHEVSSGSPSRFVAVQRLDHVGHGLTLTLPNGIQIQGLTPHNLTLLSPLLECLA